MKKQFVTYKIALKMKKLGFDEKCDALYNAPNNFLIEGLWNTKNSVIDTMTNAPKVVCSAPLWQQAIDWFFEKYKIAILYSPQKDILEIDILRAIKSIKK